MRRFAACVLTAVAGVVVTAAPSQASTPSSAAQPLRYVGMGDSYSAASGVLPPDPTAPVQCLRSTLNYPHLIAGATGAKLTDVTCGGANTSHYSTSQYPGVAPQLDAVKPDTQLITMTIGGNDSNVFISSILECGAAGISTLGQGSPCKDRYGSSFEDTVKNVTYPSLVSTLRAVKAKAPKAEIGILSYPRILPDAVGCFDRMPIATGDVPYLAHLQTTLNDVIAQAASDTGVTYVNMNEVSKGHDACQPIGTRWIEPVLQGTNPVIVHPNALGEAAMAAQTRAVLKRV